jgi:hypothetical protein
MFLFPVKYNAGVKRTTRQAVKTRTIQKVRLDLNSGSVVCSQSTPQRQL